MLALLHLLAVHGAQLPDSIHGAAGMQNCLPEGERMPTHRMRNVNIYGMDEPLRIFRLLWTSAEVVSNIGDILIRERLGVNTDTSEGAPSSSVGVMALTGCKLGDDGNYPGAADCTEANDGLLEKPIGHISFTAWEAYFSTNWHALPHTHRPLLVASIGYEGVDGIFVPKSAVAAAYLAEGADLLRHTGYDADWRQAYTYFDTIPQVLAAANGEAPAACVDVSEAGDTQAKRYLQYTSQYAHADNAGGDVDGVEDAGLKQVMKCTDGWWYSPKCRDDPFVKCIPLITSGGWTFDRMAQKAYFSKMPVAISSWSWGMYVALPKATTIMLYFWYPDATFVDLDPQFVQFTKTNAKEIREGLHRSTPASQRILKLGVPPLEGADDDVFSFMEDFSLSISDIDVFIQQYDGEGIPHFDIACQWIKDNRPVWSPWIPDLDRCPLGTGLVSISGQCELCSAGQVSVFDQGITNQICRECSAGHYCTMGATHETPCDQGYYCEAGSAKPTACPVGTSNGDFGANNTDACLACAQGTFADGEGTSLCSPCEKGYFSEEPGAAECVACQMGTFQDTTGQPKCETCQEGFTTQVMGAATDTECACHPEFYYSWTADTCNECYMGLVCPGGKGLPFVYAGYYGEPMNSTRSGQWKWDTNARQWSRTESNFEGDDNDNLFVELRLWKCPSDELACPGMTIVEGGREIKNARKVDPTCNSNDMECAKKQGCLGQLWKNGCTRCEDGFYYSADDTACYECGGGDTALFPIFLMIAYVALYGFYRFATMERSQKVTSALILASSFSIVASFFQLVGVIGFYNVQFPDILKGFFDFFRLFVLDIDVLRAACATGSAFSARFLSRTLSPLVFLAVFVCLYPASQILGKTLPFIKPMNFFKMINCVGIICSALYITLCKVSFQFFENLQHPGNTPGVLAAFPDVDYDSDERAAVLPWAIISMLLYAVGIYCFTAFLCFIAPGKIGQDKRFLMSTAFLTVRWNPNRWYWTVVVQTRNLLVALVAVMYPSTVIMQLVMTGAIVAIYTGLQASMNPWRDTFLSNADSVIGLSLILLCMFSAVLVVEPAEPEEKEFLQQQGLTYLTLVIVVSVLAFIYVVVLSALYFIKPDMKRAIQMEYAMEVATTLYLVSDLIIEAQKTPEQYAKEVLHYMTKAEQQQLLLINKVVLHEVHGVDYQSAFESLSSKRMMAKNVDSPKVSRKSFQASAAEGEGSGSGRRSMLTPAGGRGI